MQQEQNEEDSDHQNIEPQELPYKRVSKNRSTEREPSQAPSNDGDRRYHANNDDHYGEPPKIRERSSRER